jgi:hypothetical protein
MALEAPAPEKALESWVGVKNPKPWLDPDKGDSGRAFATGLGQKRHNLLLVPKTSEQ